MCTTSTSISGPHLEEKTLHITARLGIDSFLRKGNLVCKTVLGESAIVNPETVMDWKSEELPKIINVYQPKDIFNVDETGLLYNLQCSKKLMMCAIGLPDRGKKWKILLFFDQCATYPGDTTAVKNIKFIFSPQIAQAICSHWMWGSSTLSNSRTERNSYGRQQQQLTGNYLVMLPK